MRERLSGIALFLCAAVALSLESVAGDTRCRYTAEWSAMQAAVIELVNDDGVTISLRTRIADEVGERAMGFQHICPAAVQDNSILFVFPSSQEVNFHMHNVHSALDIAFVSDSGRIVDVQLMWPYDKQSSSLKPRYGPTVPIRYALEARPGFFQAHHISPQGSRLVLSSIDGN